MIPCANPRAQYLAHQKEIDAAVLGVLQRGRYILGDEVKAFEQEFAGYVGVPHGIGVGNGTDALVLALRGLGVGPGDEVITVSHTAVATVAAIVTAGAKPVLVDIEPEFYTMDPTRVAEGITPRTKAIVPVHLYGQPCDMDPILELARDRGLFVVEDCAQAHGAAYKGRRVGSLGDAGCFSFYPTKNLGALGDGGMVVARDAEVAERVRLLREYGWAERHVSHVHGTNSRLDEVQAAVLRVKLPHLEADNAARQRIARAYDEALAGTGLALPRARIGTTHVHHLYVVGAAARDRLQADLAQRGVNALVHYPQPVHLQPAYRAIIHGALRRTEDAAGRVLSLPMYPELPGVDVARVAASVREALRSAA